MDNRKELLGNRIRDARIRLSFTQQRLAKEAGFSSSQIISQIEKGERDVKAWELFNIAEALRVETSHLLKEAPEVIASVVWRKAPAKDRQLIEAEFLQRCNQYALLERLCDVVIKHRLPTRNVDLSSMSYDQAESYGKQIREQMKLGNRPASCLSGVLEEGFGIKIWYANSGIEGSAASTKGPFGLAILINSTEAPWRRNYSFAHELFHLLTWDSVDLSSIVDGEFADFIERLAEAFASSILLPEEEIIQAIYAHIKEDKLTYIDLIETAREFDVSTTALLWRLRHLDILDEEEVLELLGDTSFKELDRDVRIGSWLQPPQIPERFVRLAFIAYQMGRLSRARLAEFLNISLIDLTDRLLEYGYDDQKDYQTSIRAIRR